MNRISTRTTNRIAAALAARLHQLRQQPDAGMETADKILWAAAVIIIAGAATFALGNKISTFISGLTISLGW
jgi:hypothetical protein